jgi:hypothetical protein
VRKTHKLTAAAEAAGCGDLAADYQRKVVPKKKNK